MTEKRLEWDDFLPPEFGVDTHNTILDIEPDGHFVRYYDWYSPCGIFEAMLPYWVPTHRFNHDEFTITFYQDDEGAFDLVGHGVNFCGVDAIIDENTNAKFKVKDLQEAKRSGHKVCLRVEW